MQLKVSYEQCNILPFLFKTKNFSGFWILHIEFTRKGDREIRESTPKKLAKCQEMSKSSDFRTEKISRL